MQSILIVDDDVNLLRGLSRVLRHQPYELFTASSAELAKEMFQRKAFDLVVVDQQMQGQPGTKFIRWLSKNFPKTVRIMLTGHADVEVAMAIRDGLDIPLKQLYSGSSS